MNPTCTQFSKPVLQNCLSTWCFSGILRIFRHVSGNVLPYSAAGNTSLGVPDSSSESECSALLGQEELKKPLFLSLKITHMAYKLYFFFLFWEKSWLYLCISISVLFPFIFEELPPYLCRLDVTFQKGKVLPLGCFNLQ